MQVRFSTDEDGIKANGKADSALQLRISLPSHHERVPTDIIRSIITIDTLLLRKMGLDDRLIQFSKATS